MRSKRIGYLAALALIVFALLAGVIGCSTKATPTPTATVAPTATATVAPTATATPKPILIGITHDTSGYNADGGRSSRDAAVLAIEEWNAKGGIKGAKIQYVVRDNAGDPTKATTIAKEFVDLKVDAVSMGTSSTVAIPEAKIFTEAMIPQIGGSASTAIYTTAPDGKWYYFSVCCASPVLAEASLPDMGKKGYKRIGSIISNVAWPQDLRKISLELIASKYGAMYGMEAVADIAVDVNATDITTEVLKLKNANPDAVLGSFYPVTTSAYYSALNKLNWNNPPPPTYSYWGLTESVYLASEKKLLYGAINYGGYSGIKPELVKKKGEFMARFGYEPVGHFAITYDGVSLLLRAMDAVGTDKTAVRDWLATKAKGQPIICGRVGATADFTKDTWQSLLSASDLAFCHVDKDGKLIWDN